MDATGVKYRIFVVLFGGCLCWVQAEELCLEAHDPGNIQLSCPGGQIVFVDVTSGRGQCPPHIETCRGESASLVVETHSCYWKSNCTVEFTSDVIIRVPPENPWTENCFGVSPEFLRLNEYRCFPAPSSGIIDICSSTKVALTRGLIRSHEDYPWIYQTDSFDSKSCSVEWYGRTGEQLLVTVLDMELGEDDEFTMSLTYKNKENNRVIHLQPGANERADASKVEFTFKTEEYSNGGRGFLICFMSVGERDRIKDACEGVLKAGLVIPPRMISDESTTPAPTTTTKKPKQTGRACIKKNGKRRKNCGRQACRKKNGKRRKNCGGEVRKEAETTKTKKPKKDRKKREKKGKGKKKKRHTKD